MEVSWSTRPSPLPPPPPLAAPDPSPLHPPHHHHHHLQSQPPPLTSSFLLLNSVCPSSPTRVSPSSTPSPPHSPFISPQPPPQPPLYSTPFFFLPFHLLSHLHPSPTVLDPSPQSTQKGEPVSSSLHCCCIMLEFPPYDHEKLKLMDPPSSLYIMSPSSASSSRIHLSDLEIT